WRRVKEEVVAAAAAGAVEGQERLVEVESAVTVAEERRPVAEEKTFRPYDPEQVLLLAPVLQEWIPEGDLAHFVSDLVESGALDLSAIYAGYEEERGFPPYDPRLMVELVVYGYANGVVSSRELERVTYRDVAYGCCAPTSIPVTARSPASAVAIWRRWGGCSCRRCACADGPGSSVWACWPSMGRSCARTPRGTRR